MIGKGCSKALIYYVLSGIFLYGNWFRDLHSMVDNLLLAKLLSINCGNFDFTACNFTEKNMTVRFVGLRS